MIWSPIPGYETRYEVSDTGLVRSLVCRQGKRPSPRPMRPYVNSKGYCQVMLYDGSGRTEQPHVHRLVAVAFLGQRPGMEVDHINRDRRDNRLANLGWVTSSENNYNRDLGRVAA